MINLTPRQSQVIRLYLKYSKNTEQISSILMISRSAVRFHLDRIVDKMGFNSLKELKTRYKQVNNI